MSAKKIAITNEKGGCGKTTTAVNVSAILAERGYRVLLIDADPQSYSTMYYGLYAPENLSLSDVLFHGEKPEQAISSTEFGVDVLRSSTALMAAEELMDQRKMNGQRYNDLFVNVLSALESRYDYILIDCPPQGYKLLENIQLYADYLLIPMIADEFALHSLRLKAEKILEIRKNLNPRLRLLGGLIVMDEKNKTTGIYRDVLQSQNVLPFFKATVRKNIALRRAINSHEPINVYEKRSNGAIDYRLLRHVLWRDLVCRVRAGFLRQNGARRRLRKSELHRAVFALLRVWDGYIDARLLRCLERCRIVLATRERRAGQHYTAFWRNVQR